MRATLRANRSWFLLAGALLAIAVLNSARASQTPPPPLAATSAAPRGGLALSLWLRKLGHAVRVLDSSQPPCSGLRPRRDVLLLLMPGADIPSDSLGACLAWIQRGGTVVLATDGTSGVQLLHWIGLAISPTQPAPVQVVEPVLRRPPVRALVGLSDAVISSGPPALVVAGSRAGTVLARYREGAGSVWVLTAPWLLDNKRLRLGDNAALALNFVPPGARVVFEQYAGESAGPGPAGQNWLASTVWGVALTFAALVFLLYRWLTGLRLGPPVRPLPEDHRPATEYVLSMAGVLKSTRKRAEIASRYNAWLRRSLRARHVEDEPWRAGGALTARAASLVDPVKVESDAALLAYVREVVEVEERLEETRV